MSSNAPTKARPRPDWLKCRCCGDLPDAPMLNHELWKWVSARAYPQPKPFKHDLLCTACVEQTMGRQLIIDDLLDCLGNAFTKLYASRQPEWST